MDLPPRGSENERVVEWLLLGITPRGRATVETLHLKRDGVVNLRRLLHAMGEHPPAEPEE